MVKKGLTELEMNLKCDTSYLNSKLETSNEDQKKFYTLFLSSRNPKSLIERFYGLFTATTPECEDYETMEYYVSNLMHFSSSEN